MIFYRLFSKMFSLFPQGKVKDRIRVWLYNQKAEKEFTISKENEIWIVRYPEFKIKFSSDIVPYHVLKTNYLFTQQFPVSAVDLMVDAGAFIGSFSLYAVNKYPAIKKTIVFEPDVSTNRTLQKNIRLNDRSDIEVRSIGLWSKKDKLAFFPDQMLGSSVYDNNHSQRKIEIETDSLDNILRNVKGKRLFIKMNIEGAEIEALKGCQDVVKNNKVYLAIAADHYVDGKMTNEKVEEICKNMGLSTTTFISNQFVVVYASNEAVYTKAK